jgi:YfiH family protein
MTALPVAEAPPMLRSPLLAALPGVSHGFFTRRGGVSRGLYESLNVGLGSHDDTADVAENRRRVAAAFGRGPGALATCHQIHSATVVVADGGAEHEWASGRPRADGVVTRAAGVPCGALAADCAPVLIADARAGVVAAVHAGWRGALDGVIEAAVLAMTAQGAAPADMTAAVGPCIGPASYEVGLEFLARFEARDARNARFFSPGARADKRWFDLPGFVLGRLAAAGVGAAEWLGRDTCGEPADFFSHRRAARSGEADYGRLISVVMLQP